METTTTRKPFDFFLTHKDHISQYSYFSKRRPKFLRTLKFQQQKIVSKELFEIGKLVKYCQNIDLKKSSALEDLTSGEFKKIAKNFKSSQHFRLPLEIDQVNFDYWTILFKNCKNLTSLASPFDEMNLVHFVRAFRRKKDFKEVDFTFIDNKVVFPFVHYPSSLQKITIQCESASSEPFEIENPEEYKLAFSHMKNLRHLDLKIALHPFELCYMLSSIVNQNNLSSLGFYIGNLGRSGFYCASRLAKSLKPFKNLKRLKIHLLNSEIAFGTLEVFQNLLSLESFELTAPLSNEAELSFHGSLIGTLKSLTKLVVRFESSAKVHIPEAYTSFFRQISNMTQLKVLEFHLETKNEESNKYGGSKILSALSDFLEKLPYLEELSFKYQKRVSSSGIAILTQALNKNCRNLKRFELQFLPIEIEYKDFAAFLQALSFMKKLEALAFSGFQIKSETSCIGLFETIISLRNLRKIVLNNEIIIQKQVLLDMVTKIALKRNMKSMNLSGTLNLKGARSEKSQMTLQEIQRINPKLVQFSIHSKLKSSFFPPLHS